MIANLTGSISLALVALTLAFSANANRIDNGLYYEQCGEYSGAARALERKIAAETQIVFDERKSTALEAVRPFQNALRDAQTALSEAIALDSRVSLLEEQKSELNGKIEVAQVSLDDARAYEESCGVGLWFFYPLCWGSSAGELETLNELQAQLGPLEVNIESLEPGRIRNKFPLEKAVEAAEEALQQAQGENPAPVLNDVKEEVAKKLTPSNQSEMEVCLNEWEVLWGQIQNDLGVPVDTRHARGSASLQGLSVRSYADLLPAIESGKYPINEGPQLANSDKITIEILSSSEKSKVQEMDSFLLKIAEKFNETREIETYSSKVIEVRVRKIASGDAYQFISSGRYRGDSDVGIAYSPSNALWVKMLESAPDYKAGKFTLTDIDLSDSRASGPSRSVFRGQEGLFGSMTGVVGNTAGVILLKDVYAAKFPNGKPSSCDLVQKVVDGEISMAYTNPYVSSTGLNFLHTAMTCLAEDGVKDPLAVEKFKQFQANVPLLVETTLQMREAIRSSGIIEAGVMEYQTFFKSKIPRHNGEYNVPFSEVFEFIPFGVRHDNPLVYVGRADLTAEQNRDYESAVKKFAEFVAQNRQSGILSDKFGFFQNMDYQSAYSIYDEDLGDRLIAAQGIWKGNKSADATVVGMFVADTSGSMHHSQNNEGEDRIGQLKDALKFSTNFIKDDMHIGLIEFSGRNNGGTGKKPGIFELLPITPFSEETQKKFIYAAENLEADGGTPLYEAMAFGIQQTLSYMPTDPNVKRVVIVLSDGAPMGYLEQRQREVDAILLLARKFGVVVHMVGLGAGASYGLLEEAATLANGALIKVKTVEQLDAAIANLFNSQF